MRRSLRWLLLQHRDLNSRKYRASLVSVFLRWRHCVQSDSVGVPVFYPFFAFSLHS